MQLVSLGFVFLLLPIAAAAYYCVPKKLKAAMLFIISLLFYIQMESSREMTVMLPSLLAVDALCVLCQQKNWGSKEFIRWFYGICIGKNLLVIAVFGVILPFSAGVQAPVGVISVMLFSITALTERARGRLLQLTPVRLLAGSMFFGKLPFGPVEVPENLIAQLESPAASLTGLGQGIMRLVLGVSKQVILARQLFALLSTINRLPMEEFSVGLGWLAATTCAMGMYFTLSGFGDMAMGLGQIFSLELPRITYYPFQSPSIRDYLYRLNMPLEDTLGRLLFGEFNREEKGWHGYVISGIFPFVVALWLSPSAGLFWWACWLSALVVLDWLIFSRIPFKVAVLSRIVTFLLTIPAFLLAGTSTLTYRLTLMGTMVGISGAPLYNDVLLYLLSSNMLLLIASALFCLSIFETLSRLTRQQFVGLWWILAAGWTVVLMVVTASFLLWNVR